LAETGWAFLLKAKQYESAGSDRHLTSNIIIVEVGPTSGRHRPWKEPRGFLFPGPILAKLRSKLHMEVLESGTLAQGLLTSKYEELNATGR
jgi:hypothetical protein